MPPESDRGAAVPPTGPRLIIGDPPPPPPDAAEAVLPPPPGDQDHDGLIDTIDLCPEEAGPAANRGCPIDQYCIARVEIPGSGESPSTYREERRSLTGVDRDRDGLDAACDDDDAMSPLLPLLPIGTTALSGIIDTLMLDNMSYLPGFRGGPMSEFPNFTNGNPLYLTLFAGREVLDLSTTMMYTRMEPRLSEGWALTYDGVYLAAGGAMFVVALTRDSGSDPYMHFALRSFTDVGAARVHRHFGEGWGAVAQIGMGAVLIPVGLLAIPRRAEVTETEGGPNSMYVDPDTVDSHYDVSGNPYEGTRFPNLWLNVTLIGTNQALDGVVHGVWWLTGLGNEDQPVSPVRISLLPGSSESRPIDGAFVGVDVFGLMEALR